MIDDTTLILKLGCGVWEGMRTRTTCLRADLQREPPHNILALLFWDGISTCQRGRQARAVPKIQELRGWSLSGKGSSMPCQHVPAVPEAQGVPLQGCQQHQQDQIHLDIKATPADYPKGASPPRINRSRDCQSIHYCETTVCDLIL